MSTAVNNSPFMRLGSARAIPITIADDNEEWFEDAVFLNPECIRLPEDVRVPFDEVARIRVDPRSVPAELFARIMPARQADEEVAVKVEHAATDEQAPVGTQLNPVKVELCDEPDVIPASPGMPESVKVEEVMRYWNMDDLIPEDIEEVHQPIVERYEYPEDIEEVEDEASQGEALTEMLRVKGADRVLLECSDALRFLLIEYEFMRNRMEKVDREAYQRHNENSLVHRRVRNTIKRLDAYLRPSSPYFE